ncbi:hypothetical protein M2305_003257 [Gluconobacter cerinus]|uniref:hypothetical protein n=1 Tax=Gluconobacter cerinus TaxID=38307 RepID=UPI0022262281|nr:hypothetical protein [Gluconobacter cerinus]MCW2267238.1 hypothetical protein [Gluconobacter cerinus]
MNYQTITNLVQYGNHLFNTYPTFFHALLPVGTILTAILGMKNSHRIEKQAKRQIDIEISKYKLELFDKRFKVWTEFQSMVLTPPGPVFNPTYEQLGCTLEKINENMKYTKKAILLFSPDKNFNVLHDFNVTSATFHRIISIVMGIQLTMVNAKREMEKAQEEQTSYEEGSIGYISKKYIFEQKEKVIQQAYENIYEHNQALIRIPSEYNKLRLKCELYMESLLSAPKQAFEEDEKGWIGTSLDYVTKTGPIHGRFVIWLALAACVLFLGMLICS